MDRRAFLGVLGLLTPPVVVEAQKLDRVPRIGYIANDGAREPRGREAFLRELRDLGYMDGRNLTIEYRDAEGRGGRLPSLAAELVALKVDVIVTAGGTRAALAAKQATTTIPIVFATAGDPVVEGLVTSLARPGSNVTGLSVVTPDLIGKSLELLKLVTPGMTRVALLLNPDSLPERARKERLERAAVAAQRLGVQLQVVEARAPGDIDRFLRHGARAYGRRACAGDAAV